MNGKVLQDEYLDPTLQDRTVLLRLALDSADIGIHVWDVATDTLLWDGRLRQLWGIGPDESVDYGVFIAGVHPEDRAATQAAVDRALDPAGDGRYVAEYRVVGRDDGITRWVKATGQVFFAGGRPVRLVGTVRDDTDCKRSEEALRASAAEYRALFEMAGVGNAEVDLHTGRFLRVNRKYCELLSYDAQELLAGMTFLDVTHPDDRASNRHSVAALLRGPQDAFEIEKRYVRKDGSVFWAHVTVTLMRDANGRPTRLLGTVHDTTERKRAEEALAASKERQAFMLALSDTLRPLGDPVEIQAEAARVLGEHLGANRVAYFEVRGSDFVVERDYTDGAPKLGGRYPIDGFGSTLLATYRAGLTATASDVDADPHLTCDERAAYAAIQIAAYIGVPLVKDGQLVAGLAVHAARARAWTANDIALAEVTAERTWDAVTRARAEIASRESEERLRSVLAHLPGGGAFIVDRELRYLLAAGEALAAAGVKPVDLVGKTLFEALDPELAALYAPKYRAALEGEPFTHEHEAHDRYYVSRGMPLRDATGRVDAVLAVSYDITERKLAENRLRRNAETFRLLVEDNPFGIYVVDADFRIRYASKDARRTFAHVQPLIGRDLAEALRVVWPEPFASEAIERFRHTLAAGEPYAAPSTVEKRADIDAVEAYDWRIERILLPDDRLGVVCYYYDLSERQRLEGELRDSEERLQIALEAAEAGVFDWQLRTGELYWTAGHYTLLGLAPGGERPSYELWRRHVHPEDLARVEAAMQAAIESGERYVAEYRVRGADGVERWVQGQGVLVPPTGADATRMVGAIVDITARKRAEARAWSSERRFRVMADGVPAMIWVTNAQGGIEFVNREYSSFFGVTLEQLQTNGWQSLVHPEDAERYVGEYMRALVDHAPFHARARVRDASQRWRWIESSGMPRFSATGEFLGHVVLSPDVTEIVATQQALQDADRRKDEFLATLSHELRNPLAPIRNAAQLLASPHLSDAELVRIRQMIQRQVRHMALLLDDLLDVARITSGKLQLKKERVPLTRIVDAAVESARPLIDAKQHRLVVALPAQGAELDADPVRLAQVITNLLANAAKYTDPGGRIELTAATEREVVSLSVKDTGIGIAAESLASVFSMFSQVQGAAERSEGGLGIGLALAKGLVELHGGTIEAQSEGLGQGSTFVVRLPVRETPVAATASSNVDASSAPRGHLRVLVADDNKDAADSLAMLLQLDGHEVRVAHSGTAALATTHTFRPEFALLDIGMPGLNGYELARAIRREPWGRAVTLVALTGWGQEEDKRRAFDAGFDAHLTKPVDPAEVERLLAQHARDALDAASNIEREAP